MEKSSSRIKKATIKKVAKKTAKAAIKKATIKKVGKRVTNKNTATKNIPLIVAPKECQFWVNDGQILADLVALAESFAAMDDLLFNYHANDIKNDFAEWVEYVLDDASCAASLRKADTPKKAHQVVVRRLRYYNC